MTLIILPSSSQSEAHEGVQVNEFQAYALAHKGKASSSVTYNPDDPAEAYSNASVHSRLSEYTSAGKAVHGPEWDPTTAPLDTEIIMRIGGGKAHGRYWMADGIIDTASTPSLSQIRARSSDGSVPIRPRPAAQTYYHALEVIHVLFVVH